MKTELSSINVNLEDKRIVVRYRLLDDDGKKLVASSRRVAWDDALLAALVASATAEITTDADGIKVDGPTDPIAVVRAQAALGTTKAEEVAAKARLAELRKQIDEKTATAAQANAAADMATAKLVEARAAIVAAKAEGAKP